jgi:phage terminase Nu1 subunit (DNA packaging protein)
MMATHEKETETRPEAAMRIPELADTLGVTPRRIRQMRENGELIRRGRGWLDSPHALNASLGRRWLGQNRRADSMYAEAGVGWLLGHKHIGVGTEELAAWYEAAARWGLTKAEATAELFNAARLLGDQCPQFHVRPGGVGDED